MYNGDFSSITIALTGDVMLAKRMPSVLPENIKAVSDILKSTDCAIGNLETTVHDGEGIPEAFPGGGYAMSSSNTLYDLKNMGFKMMACANNHSMDYGHSGLLATIKNLKLHDIQYCGIGANLAEASRPCYYDTTNGRIALISVTSSFHDSYLAGPQNQDMKGRPGVNPMRHNAIYELSPQKFNQLIEIASIAGVNSYHAQAIAEGYLTDSPNFKFGTLSFRIGVDGTVCTTPNQLDQKRIIDSITEAKNLADIVILSIHGHQFNKEKITPPRFLQAAIPQRNICGC